MYEKDGSIIRRKVNRTPNQKEILAHAPLLDYQIKTIQPKLIVTMGNIALQRLLGKHDKISAVHGTLLHSPIRMLDDMETTTYSYTNRFYDVFPTYHPASIFYNHKLRSEIYEDLACHTSYDSTQVSLPVHRKAALLSPSFIQRDTLHLTVHGWVF